MATIAVNYIVIKNQKMLLRYLDVFQENLMCFNILIMKDSIRYNTLAWVGWGGVRQLLCVYVGGVGWCRDLR